MDDSERVAALEDRIDKLEALTKKMMPSRRDALKLGGAAAIGAATMSGTASAGSNQVGTIGDANNLVDIEAEDVTINDTLNGASISGAAQDEALLSDGAGGLTFGSAGGGVPPNFTYQDVTSNRNINTTFTNTSGKALYVIVTLEVTSDDSQYGIRAVVDGVSIIDRQEHDGVANQDHRDIIQFFVPNGSTYAVNEFYYDNNPDIVSWFEAMM